jgi:hypothetical protein
MIKKKNNQKNEDQNYIKKLNKIKCWGKKKTNQENDKTDSNQNNKDRIEYKD